MLCSDWGPVHLGHTARTDRSVKRGFCPPYLTIGWIETPGKGKCLTKICNKSKRSGDFCRIRPKRRLTGK